MQRSGDMRQKMIEAVLVKTTLVMQALEFIKLHHTEGCLLTTKSIYNIIMMKKEFMGHISQRLLAGASETPLEAGH